MPGSQKCQSGCACKKHSRRLDLSPEQREQRHREQSREAMRRYYARTSDACPSCGQPKTRVSELCGECRRGIQRAEAISPEERRRQNAEYMKQRRLADPERARREAREQYAKNGRKHNLKWKFGLTPERLADMLAAQDGLCYLCGEPLAKGSIHIDHDRSCCRGDRSCGTCVRGLACLRCNTGIGHFGDDPERMRRVADNLELASRLVRNPAGAAPGHIPSGIETPLADGS